MRIIKTELKAYKFDELSKEGEENAIEKLRTINTDYNWWESVYEDVKIIDCKIDGFSLDRWRGSFVNFSICSGAEYTAGKIIGQHGEKCGIYQLAKAYLAELDEKTKFLGTNANAEREEIDENMREDFEHELGKAYILILRQEEEYRMSDKAIIETIEANEYEFTAEGELI